MKAPARIALEALSLLLILSILVPTALPAPAYAMSTGSNPPQAVSAAAPFGCFYVVRPGDDLFRIGLRFGISYFTLAAANGIPPFALIFPGMVLRVPCTNPPPSTICNIHFVQRGEWLALIARNFGVSTQSIIIANRLVNPNFLFVGQRLLIPCR